MATYNLTIYPQPIRKNRIRNLTAQRFGRLLVLGFAGMNGRYAMWHCLCDCGMTTTISKTGMLAGKTKSCGCYRSEVSQRVAPLKDLTGKRFGRWLIIKLYQRTPVLWTCECECGQIKNVSQYTLTKGRSQSCGCLNSEVIAKRNFIHGSSHTAEYAAFHSALGRCTNPSNPQYDGYSGKGIEFRFTSFHEFLSEVGYRPSPNHSLERIKNKKHYEKGNIMWATPKQQCRNRSSNHHLTLNGSTKILVEWGEILQMKPATILGRHKRGWCDDCILTIPINGGKCIHPTQD